MTRLEPWKPWLAGFASAAALTALPAAAAAQGGPWQHAREPRDRSLSCEALWTEIGEIDSWRASRWGDGASGAQIDGYAAAEVAARRTGNHQASGVMRDMQNIFGGGQRSRQPARQTGPDPEAVATQRRGHLLSIYDGRSCWRELAAEGQPARPGPWLDVRLPNDTAMACDALEEEIGMIDDFIAGEGGTAPQGGPDAGAALRAGQSVAGRTGNWRTAQDLSDARRVTGADRPRQSGPTRQDRALDIAYQRRHSLMSKFEQDACWDQFD